MKSNLTTIILVLPLLLLAGGREEEEIDKAIAQAPAMMLSQTDDVGAYIRQTCDKIAKLPNAPTRYRCFRKLMGNACRVDFAQIEDMVPQQQIKMPEGEDFQRERLRKILQERASRFRRMKISSIKGCTLGCLRLLADHISSTLLMENPKPAPDMELYDPYFKLIAKLKEEERNEDGVSGYYDSVVDQLEFLFNVTHLKVLKLVGEKPVTQDRAAVEARFKQVIGRPIRSVERYWADSHRRMEANIREHRKQEEANRRAAEYQRQFNKGHSINVE